MSACLIHSLTARTWLARRTGEPGLATGTAHALLPIAERVILRSSGTPPLARLSLSRDWHVPASRPGMLLFPSL
jgi:hypothetical protein